MGSIMIIMWDSNDIDYLLILFLFYYGLFVVVYRAILFFNLLFFCQMTHRGLC